MVFSKNTNLSLKVNFDYLRSIFQILIVDCSYFQATFYETVRTTCSAIVPHVANRNTTIAGFYFLFFFGSLFRVSDRIFGNGKFDRKFQKD